MAGSWLLRDRPLSFEAQIALSYAVAACLLIAALCSFGVLQAREQDRAQTAATTRAIEQAIGAKAVAFRSWLRGYALWDDLYRHGTLDTDADWLDTNLGSGVWETFTVPMSGVFILDGEQRQHFAYWSKGRLPALRDVKGVDLQREIARADASELPLVSRVELGGDPYFFGVARIRPITAALEQSSAGGRYLILFQPIAGGVIAEIGAAMSVDGLHWVRSAAATVTPQIDVLRRSGARGRLTWRAARPGRAMLRAAVVPTLLLVSTTLVIGAVQYGRARHLARLLRAEQRVAADEAEKSRGAAEAADKARAAAETLIQRLGEEQRAVARLSDERDREQRLHKREVQEQSSRTLTLFESEFSSVLNPIVAIADALDRQASALEREAVAGDRAAAIASERARSTAEVVGRVVADSAQLEIATHSLEEDIHRAAEVTQRAQQVGAELVTRLQQLAGRATGVEDVIASVAEIAARINLLALNARIEASRAGVAGLGFAVLADEVKQLAESTARQVAQIAGVLREIKGQGDIAAMGAETIGEMMSASAAATSSSHRALDAQAAIVRAIGRIASAAEAEVTDADAAIEDLSRLVGSSETMARSVNMAAHELSRRAETLRHSALLFTGRLRQGAG